VPQNIRVGGNRTISPYRGLTRGSAADEAAEIEYHEKAGLMHAYPLFFFPESREARDRITHFVRGTVARA
jgi:hypothetical protein